MTQSWPAEIAGDNSFQYLEHKPGLPDKRQLAGYTRLRSVYQRLNVPYNEIIKGLIVYSHQDCPTKIEQESLFVADIAEYVEFYKLGIGLPEITENLP